MPVVIKFGTDGWRGLIAEDFTFSNLRKVAYATARYLKERQSVWSKSNPVLIGYDRRFLSEPFARAVATVLNSQGIATAVSTDPMPTPALSVLVVDRKASLGITITASHNPALYNGYKIKDPAGRSAPTEMTQDIEARIGAIPADLDLKALSGSSETVDFNPWPVYESYLRRRLDWKAIRSLKGRIVFDHLHGVGAGIPERLLKSTRLDVISLHAGHDPLFADLHPEPIEENLSALKSEVRKRKALMGIALDGDADRLGIVDDTGTYWTPHQVFPLLVLHCIEHKKWKGKIVQSVSLGALGERIAKAFDLPFEEVPVGFKYIAERMLREDVLAGGEESGGYAVRGGIPERDGILSGLLVLEMVAARGEKPSQLLRAMEARFGRARFRRIDMPLERAIPDKADFVAYVVSKLPAQLIGLKIAEARQTDGLKVVLANGAWVLLRPSGTEPLVRIYSETDQASKTNELLKWAGKAVQDYFSHLKRS